MEEDRIRWSPFDFEVKITADQGELINALVDLNEKAGDLSFAAYNLINLIKKKIPEAAATAPENGLEVAQDGAEDGADMV